MNKVCNFMKNCADRAAMLLGVAAFFLIFYTPDKESAGDTVRGIVIMFAGFVGVVYTAAILFRWAWRKVEFDWLLVNGHFLRKIVTVVILTPFALMFIAGAVRYAGNILICGDSDRMAASPLLNRNIDTDELFAEGESGESIPIEWIFYYHFIDPGNQHSATTAGGRLLVALLAALGIVLLNGLLVTTLINWFDSRRERWLRGETRYPGTLHNKPHYVIIGGNDMVAGIVSQLLPEEEKRLPYVVIQTSRDVESFRRELFSSLNERQQRRIIIHYGNLTSATDIADLALDNALEVCILGEQCGSGDSDSNHDALNMECLQLVSADCKARCNSAKKAQGAKPLVCRVMFEYQTSFSIFQFSEISEEIKKYIAFKPFNYYEMWAQKVLVCKDSGRDAGYSPTRYIPLDGSGIGSGSEEFVHLVVVGMSRMGTALAIEAAHLAHYPNYETRGLRTRITFIDPAARSEKEFFIGRFKSLFALSNWRYGEVGDNGLQWREWNRPDENSHLGGDFLDIEWEFIHGSVELAAVQEYLELSAAEPHAKMTVAICLPEENRATAAAIYLPKSLYANVQQVLVYQRTNSSMLDGLVGRRYSSPYDGKLRAFGMADCCYDKSLIEQGERIADTVNRRYCNPRHDDDAYTQALVERFADRQALAQTEADLRAMNERFLGDTAFMERNNAEVEALCRRVEATCLKEGVKRINKTEVASRWSSLYNANMLWSKLRSVGYTEGKELSERDVWDIANTEHNRWNMEQLLMTYSPLDEVEFFNVMHYRQLPLKNIYKGAMKHFNICSNDVLKASEDSFKLDVSLTRDLVENLHMLSEEPTACLPAVRRPDSYVPAPADVSDVTLPAELEALGEAVARNVHEVWAEARIKEGWRYGKRRNERKKTHQCLVPYEQLPEHEKAYDRNTAFGTLRLICKLGFRISKK